MAKKAIVTGARGFLGKHLTAYLTQQKVEVYPLIHSQFHEYLSEDIKKVNPDYIIHAAAFGNMSEHDSDWDSILSANILGTYNLLKACNDVEYKAFINISTSSVMLDYTTMYSATKASGELLCDSFAFKYQKPIISVRPFSIYGEEEQETHLIPRLFRSCLFNEPLKLSPDPVHDYVYVKDVVSQLLEITRNVTECPSTVVQVGTGVQTSNGELVRLIEQITGRRANIVGELEPKPYDSGNWKASPEKGWVYFQTTPLLEGLQKVYSSYKL